MSQNDSGTRLRGAVCTLAATVAIAASLVAGCGVKGPLKLPPAAPGSAQPPSAQPPSAQPAQPPEAIPAEPPPTPSQPDEPRKP